jgi:tetrahydromethanopterin S-methyltransferase subunit G
MEETLPVIGTCRINTGEDVLQSLSFDEASIGKDIATLFGLYIGIRILAYLVLAYRARKLSSA